MTTSAKSIEHLENILSHLLLALSSSLQKAQMDSFTWDTCDVLLQAFAYQTQELGRLMAMLIHTCRHVWLAQSSIMEVTRRILHQLPAEPVHISRPDSIGLYR